MERLIYIIILVCLIILGIYWIIYCFDGIREYYFPKRKNKK